MNIITKMEIGKRNKDRVNIYIDDEFAFSLSAEIVYKEGLKLKQSIDVDVMKRIADEDNYMKCKNSALKIIERTYKTEKEIRDKLIQKEYSNDSIDKTIKFMREYNFINDYNYAKMYINDKLKSQGERKIKYALIAKGIDESIIMQELSRVSQDSQKDIAKELAIKKYNVLAKRESDKFKLSQKLFRFLMGKGYEYDIVAEIVKEVTTVIE